MLDTNAAPQEALQRRPAKMPGHVEGYVNNYLRVQFWRVAQSMEWNECINEAWLVWDRVCRKYPNTEPKHKMALFQRAWSNQFHNLSNVNTKNKAEITSSDVADDLDPIDLVPCSDGNQGELFVLIERAPDEVRQVALAMLDAPQDVFELICKMIGQRKTYEANARLCRHIGADYCDLIGKVRRYFSNAAV